MRKYDYQNSIAFIVKSAAKAFETAFDQQLRNRVGITVTQSRVIGTLMLVRDGMTQKEIADRIGVEAPTLVPIIDKLEEQKMVVRKLDPNDRRNNLIFLTSKSEAKWELIIDCAWELEKASCQGLSEEELELAKTFLSKIARNVAGLSQKSNSIDSRRENNNAINIRKYQPLQHQKEKTVLKH